MFDPNRARSFQMAAVDRQAVFKGDCASCHATPAKGKSGKELYDSVCGICHEGANRATMVPDLHHLKVPTGADFWKTWITLGKTNSLMPAFTKSEGGPLTKSQIASLAKYLAKAIPSQTNHFE
jgi:mono/diheme cytochrome c family protein